MASTPVKVLMYLICISVSKSSFLAVNVLEYQK